MIAGERPMFISFPVIDSIIRQDFPYVILATNFLTKTFKSEIRSNY